MGRIEVIPDDETEIIEAIRRMSGNYDMVVTSGGIGPTHDDIVQTFFLSYANSDLPEHCQGVQSIDGI